MFASNRDDSYGTAELICNEMKNQAGSLRVKIQVKCILTKYIKIGLLAGPFDEHWFVKTLTNYGRSVFEIRLAASNLICKDFHETEGMGEQAQ